MSEIAGSKISQLSFVDIPTYTNEWDNLYDAIMEAKANNKAVYLAVNPSVSPASYRQNIVSAMKTRGISINTNCATNGVFVWYRGNIVEVTE
jgi:hypothetical protein